MMDGSPFVIMRTTIDVDHQIRWTVGNLDDIGAWADHHRGQKWTSEAVSCPKCGEYTLVLVDEEAPSFLREWRVFCPNCEYNGQCPMCDTPLDWSFEVFCSDLCQKEGTTP